MVAGEGCDWDAIRHAYCESEDSVASILLRFNCSHSALYQRARRQHWPLRSKVATQGKPQARPEPSGPRPGPRASRCPGPRGISPAMQRRLIARLCAAIELVLSEMEKRMENDQPTSAADRERDARAAAVLLRGLENLTELNPEPSQSEPAGGARAAKSADAEGDHDDRLRRELALRIARFRRTGNPVPGS